MNIELIAKIVRVTKPRMDAKTGGPNDMFLDGRMEQWQTMRDMIGQTLKGSDRIAWNEHISRSK